MKAIALIALIVCAAAPIAFAADDRVQIYLYYESLCPYCRDFIIGSFKTAVNTPDFEKICDYRLIPYGNARERRDGSQWAFTCQHGVSECEGNLLENCALRYVPDDKKYNFIICIEDAIESVNTWQEAADQCSQELSINLDQVNQCVAGTEGNQLVHQAAVETDALNPPHKYVPWITYDGTHSSADEDAIENNMVKFACQNYKGSVKIAACDKYVTTSAGEEGSEYYFGFRPFFNKCFKNPIFDKINKAVRNMH